MTTTADHTPEPVNNPEVISVNADPSVREHQALNTEPARKDGRAVNGNVVEFRPGTTNATDVVHAEIVDEPAKTTTQVDPVPHKPSWWETVGDATARPLVASWLLSAEEFKSRAAFLVRYAGHTTAFHALRVPVYVPAALLKAPGALVRHGARLRNWVFDAESKPVRMDARERKDFKEYMALREARNDTVRKRMGPVMLAVIVLAALVYLAVMFVAPFWNWAAMLVTLCLVGWFGAPKDKPVAGRAVDSAKAPRLTSAMIEDALGALGIAGINQAIAKGRGIAFPSPIMRDGPGWRADIDLPPGVTAGDVIDRRERLSSGLRRQLGCVWPEGDASVHEGRLVLWVGDKDMSTTKQAPWPLAKPGATVDLFKPQPFGTDQRGRWVPITLMFSSGAIGAIPRMGKTVALRELLLIAALDPRAVLYAYDLKGTGDLSPLAAVAHGYGVGDDPEDIETAVVELRQLRDELRRRAKVIRNLPEDVCPDNKVTPALASNKELGLAPIVIGVDECQVWFEHGEYGDELREICTDLVKRGPALGITLLLATQRPDAKAIPTDISANLSIRYCLKVMGQTENDMVLGTSQYKNGVRATTFAWSDKGIGYLRGEGSDAQITRSVYQDGPTAKRIVAGARKQREALGNITGYAAGESVDVEAARVDTLADTLSVFGKGEQKLWSDVIVARLAELRPGTYGKWTPANLATALKPDGVKPKQVWATDPETGKGSNRNGYTRDSLSTAQGNRK
ncbi:DNA segregation ATPase FtsK/SpoIIIE, S-DNA-T family [Prauserella marina]|uniref:DNA segregation ATPase FtsK/SpoIIIE, S-DNA-T family n=1 Tax=Prauserella marina TaxID=530584 RepID=A0A1G6P1F3_9PSEU|nr:FtsK/SpoIIIE domain-containing protein [Prauserella marina]PWV82658.1 S-DNA-T family DNA segregation ATPase FtsK/SpoIIIE [Prauserella marina]SDC74022.1 DNA segregation ATPase FtsK/SpoIIIE, S-DNA-T family [Prauserella marina]